LRSSDPAEYDRPTEAEQWHGLAMALYVAGHTSAFRDWDIGDVGDETDRFCLAAGPGHVRT
jgi:hypothetical protein